MSETPTQDEQPLILGADSRPLRKKKAADDRCPDCGSGSDKRQASGGFGERYPVCSRCGHEFLGERFDG